MLRSRFCRTAFLLVSASRSPALSEELLLLLQPLSVFTFQLDPLFAYHHQRGMPILPELLCLATGRQGEAERVGPRGKTQALGVKEGIVPPLGDGLGYTFQQTLGHLRQWGGRVAHALINPHPLHARTLEDNPGTAQAAPGTRPDWWDHLRQGSQVYLTPSRHSSLFTRGLTPKAMGTECSSALGQGTSALGQRTSALGPGTSTLKQGTSMLGPDSSTLELGTSTLGPVTPTLEQGISALGPGTSTLEQGTSALGPVTPTLEHGTSALGPGTSTLEQGTSALGPVTPTLEHGTSALGPGTSTLEQGTSTLGVGTSTLEEGTSSLGPGTSTLEQETSALGPGTSALGPGTSALGPGTSALEQGTSTLGPGTSTLEQGTSTLGPGTSTLEQGTSALGPGTSRLTQLSHSGGILSELQATDHRGVNANRLDSPSPVPHWNTEEQQDPTVGSAAVSDRLPGDRDGQSELRARRPLWLGRLFGARIPSSYSPSEQTQQEASALPRARMPSAWLRVNVLRVGELLKGRDSSLRLTAVMGPATQPAKPVRKVRTVCDHTATAEGQLSFQEGAILEVVGCVDEDWIRCCHGNTSGLVPIGYTSLI
ncbi:uncharacterized protein LOC132813612 [Hemiscyllium ocellatum]|uniref:uncharacterized protein LOC132813612 n=1 Tax=Hemiscyllium ocellatum TaxID=170820 RepID=UPI0029670DE4|nr:uncharacterized protein LOC132813612 [Hemiscyllium ocellatum]